MLLRILLLLLWSVCGIFGPILPSWENQRLEQNSNVEFSNLQTKFQKQTEKFTDLYLTSFEQKLTNVLAIVTEINSNLKSLQEKAHVWDLYRHHIDAWDDHMKSLDQKIDLIKYKQDDTKSIESKLTSLEFSINHIISKLVQMDGKPSPLINFEDRSRQDIHDILTELNNERSENKQILKRLNNILRHVVSVENSNRREPNYPKIEQLMHPVGKEIDSAMILRVIESKLDNLSKNIVTKDIKQFSALSRKNSKTLEDILELINNVDERTIRLFDAEAQHSAKYLNVCQSTTNELSTFTESSDLLLKRIETLVSHIKEKVEKISVIKDEEVIDEHYPDTTTEFIMTVNSSTDGLETSVESDETQEEIDTIPDSNFIDFSQPLKRGCHDLTVRVDGVYVFSEVSDLNAAGRNFNERCCTFPTEGPGWTVMQRRGPYDFQENFNRSWADYRNGFGSLAKDFWFGNEFVHRMVYKDTYELRIELEDFQNQSVWAEYSIFQIDAEKLNYNLLIGGYRGAVPDSMLYHHNQDFSTYDRRNDKSVDLCCACATGYGSGWWFDNCAEANLNGIYQSTPLAHNFIGILWENWHGDYSLKKTRMLIRPKSFNESDDLDLDLADDP